LEDGAVKREGDVEVVVRGVVLVLKEPVLQLLVPVHGRELFRRVVQVRFGLLNDVGVGNPVV